MKYLISFFSAFFVALTLMTATGCASTPIQEVTSENVDDSIITSSVKMELFNEPRLRSGAANVETFEGVVQLSGFVNSSSDTDRAVEIARGVKGVKSVKNDMRIK